MTNENASLDQICADLRKRHESSKSWEKAGEAYGLNKATARLLAMGREPGKKIRTRLGLPPSVTVIVIGGGSIPEGAQVISASMCECGQWFISNHPARKKCFICRPYRKHKK